eukprot:2328314-Pyramimonas_sp.AAC.1
MITVTLTMITVTASASVIPMPVPAFVTFKRGGDCDCGDCCDYACDAGVHLNGEPVAERADDAHVRTRNCYEQDGARRRNAPPLHVCCRPGTSPTFTPVRKQTLPRARIQVARIPPPPVERPMPAASAWSEPAPPPGVPVMTCAEKDYTAALFAGDELRMSELLRTSGERHNEDVLFGQQTYCKCAR